MTSLALLAILVQPTSATFLQEMRTAVGSGSEQRVRALFGRPKDADPLLEMAKARGGLMRVQSHLIPTPKGWGPERFWAVFSTRQEIQSYRDLVYRVQPVNGRPALTDEVSEAAPQIPIKDADIQARLDPPNGKIDVTVKLTFASGAPKAMPVWRLGTDYKLQSVTIDGKTMPILAAGSDRAAEPKPGDVLRAGPLIIPQTTGRISTAVLTYGAKLDSADEDRIEPRFAHVTAWWVPSVGRLPHTTSTTINAPATWEVRSEGELQGSELIGDRKIWRFRCDVPISYPKIVGGEYTLAATATDRGRIFRSYQLQPPDQPRATRDVEQIRRAIAWFEDRLGPFPFGGYDVFDAERYYGIESYSYTLLRRDITTRFVAHEIGHTYFGGLVPCAYVRDSWNEGVTQYVDSVVFQENQDKTLEAGLATLGVEKPLTAMFVPHADQGATYWRGAYAMKMLEAEIGQEKVFEALRRMVAERRGKDTVWNDLLPYFEKAGGMKLDWFWDQWIRGAMFPTLEMGRLESEDRGDAWHHRLTVRQSGTPRPYRLRFRIRLVTDGGPVEQIVTTRSPMETFSFRGSGRAREAKIEVLGLTLARVKPSN
jgi:aminopeptidase N